MRLRIILTLLVASGAGTILGLMYGVLWQIDAIIVPLLLFNCVIGLALLAILLIDTWSE